MIAPLRRRTWRLAAAGLALGLAGCAAGPDFQRPAPPAVDAFLAGPARPAAPGAQRLDAGLDVRPDWWTLFGSPGLDELMNGALHSSPTLQAADAVLRESQDNLKAGYGIFFPQIGASVASSRQNSLEVLNHKPVSTGVYGLGTLGASVSYAPDLFGGARRQVEALGAKVDSQRYAALAAWLSLTGNVANTAIARAGYQAQAEALRAILALQDEQIRLAAVQVDAGTAAWSTVLALRSQQASDRATLAALQQRIDESEDLLAELGGRTPAQAALPAIALADLKLPMALPAALPSTLARRRPDILAAEADLHAASAQIGVATADLFPSLTLGGSGGTAHGAVAQVLEAGTHFWSLQASLAASLFSGGSDWYARRAAIDAYDAALADYRQTVLVAFDQVADALRALDNDALALQADAEAEAAAADNLKIVTANERAGLAGTLDLLAADAQWRQARVALAGAQAQRLQDTVALYAALGGGWWNDPARKPVAEASRGSP